MSKIKQYRYIHGPMIDQVIEECGINASDRPKEVIKKMLKRAHGIKSLGQLDEAGLSYFIEQSAILLAGEFAIALRFPGEERVEDGIRSFYKALYQKETTDDGSTTETTEDS